MPSNAKDLQNITRSLPISAANTTLLEIRQMDAAPLSSLARITGSKSECYGYIGLELNDITFHFGVEWKDRQIASCAELLYENYYYLTAPDWTLFFKKCKSLLFGKVYGIFSPSQLMEWAATYAAEWTELSIELSLNAHNQHKSDKMDARVSKIAQSIWNNENTKQWGS